MEALWRNQLAGQLPQTDIALASAQIDLLVRYLALLDKWNRTFNLTAVRDPREMVGRHLVDSLSVLPCLAGRRLLDVGSGAGLPGIPIAIARPDLEVTLLDSNSKKTRFLAQVSLELNLANVSVVHSRVERYRASQPFDTAVSRAFASLRDFWRKTQHLVGADGRLVAMKGRPPRTELDEIGKGGGVCCELVVIAESPAPERTLVVMRRCPS